MLLLQSSSLQSQNFMLVSPPNDWTVACGTY